MSDIVEQPVVGEPVPAAASEAAVSPVVVPASAPGKSRRKVRSEEETAYWRGFVDEWHGLVDSARAAGGLLPTVRGFCEQRELREPSFYWWRREFAIRDGKLLPTKRSADSARIASHMGAHPAASSRTAFVQLHVKPGQGVSTHGAALCELVVGRVVVRLSPGFDANELARLLDVLTTQTG